jgi:integrase
VSLKIADIDSVRMQIFVERAKGKKDRYVNLSPIVLDILRKYITDYLPRPKVYLFKHLLPTLRVQYSKYLVMQNTKRA